MEVIKIYEKNNFESFSDFIRRYYNWILLIVAFIILSLTIINDVTPLQSYPDIPLRYADLSNPVSQAGGNAIISLSPYKDPQGNSWAQMNYRIPVGGFAYTRIEIGSANSIDWRTTEAFEFNIRTNLTDFVLFYFEVQERQSNGEMGELLIASVSVTSESEYVILPFSKFENKTIYQPVLPESEKNGQLDIEKGISAIILHGGFPSNSSTQLIFGNIRLIGTEETPQWYHQILGIFSVENALQFGVTIILLYLKPDKILQKTKT